ncbi:MAG: hypothetical protein KatS3mg002_0190 [Candidatus Woesearchaeota archaeon]|nr:MAG: hypothetical protein KatS3mg002_0190 [Candidatus Woesearchaeota archaeon]
MKNILRKISSFYMEHRKIIIFVLITFLITGMLFILRPVIINEINKNPELHKIYMYINTQISNRSILWLFLATFFGSIFLFSIPVELIFAYYIISDANIVLSIIAATIGTISARCINFFIGTKFKHLTTHLREKDEDFKKKFNRTQTSLIFLGNFIPAFPVEHFAVFVGTTHYNFKKFLIYQLLGKILKFILIVLFIKSLILNIEFINMNIYELTKNIVQYIIDILL